MTRLRPVRKGSNRPKADIHFESLNCWLRGQCRHVEISKTAIAALFISECYSCEWACSALSELCLFSHRRMKATNFPFVGDFISP